MLAEPARPDVRAQHVAAAAAEVRHNRAVSSAQALARRSARIVAGVAATIVVTSSLAGAEILVQPARAIFPSVSERLIPHRSADKDPGDYVVPEIEQEVDEADEDAPTTSRADRRARQAPAERPNRAAVTSDSVMETVKKTTSTSTAPSTTTSTEPPSTSSTTTTEPDSSTTTTEPDPSTTTTEPDSSTTTTEPDPSTTTTTTTVAPVSSKKVPPAHGRGGG